MLVASKGKKKNSMKVVVCWGCRQTEYVKSNCKDGAGSTKGYELNANSISLFMGESDVT